MSLNDAQRKLQKKVWFRAKDSAKNNFLPPCLETSLAWKFLFLCSFFKNCPWTFEKNSIFNKLWASRVGLKEKIRGSQGEKLAKRGNETTAVARKVQQKYRDTACKAIFSLFIWHRLLKFMLQHTTVWFDWKQSKYPAKNCFYMNFCTRGRLMYKRLRQRALADHCIYKSLKNLPWLYWRLIWRQNCFDMHHWALGCSEKFHFGQFKN